MTFLGVYTTYQITAIMRHRRYLVIHSVLSFKQGKKDRVDGGSGEEMLPSDVKVGVENGASDLILANVICRLLSRSNS